VVVNQFDGLDYPVLSLHPEPLEDGAVPFPRLRLMATLVLALLEYQKC